MVFCQTIGDDEVELLEEEGPASLAWIVCRQTESIPKFWGQ